MTVLTPGWQAPPAAGCFSVFLVFLLFFEVSNRPVFARFPLRRGHFLFIRGRFFRVRFCAFGAFGRSLTHPISGSQAAVAQN